MMNSNTKLLFKLIDESYEPTRLCVFKILSESPEFDINATNEKNETVLIVACNYKYFDVIDVLLNNNNLEVNIRYKNTTLLGFLALNEKFTIFEKLIKHNKLDINYKNNNNESILIEALDNTYILNTSINYIFMSVTDHKNFNINIEDYNITMLYKLYKLLFNSINTLKILNFGTVYVNFIKKFDKSSKKWKIQLTCGHVENMKSCMLCNRIMYAIFTYCDLINLFIGMKDIDESILFEINDNIYLHENIETFEGYFTILNNV